MTQVFAIRPEPGCSATVAAADDLGLSVSGVPLFSVEQTEWTQPEGPFDALLAGSANVFRHGGGQLGNWRDLPVLAVGSSTADAARAAGFTVAMTASGGLQSLLGELPDGVRRLFRPCGDEHVPLTPPPGITITPRAVYRTVAQPMPASLAAQLRGGGIVLLHSAQAAAHLAAECDRLTIPRARLTLAAIGPRVAAVCGLGWKLVASAPSPDDAALLALARSLCQ